MRAVAGRRFLLAASLFAIEKYSVKSQNACLAWNFSMAAFDVKKMESKILTPFFYITPSYAGETCNNRT